MAIEPGRLRRGAELAIRQLGQGEYAVQGSKSIRYVNLNIDTPCDCEDTQYRAHKGPCKHVLACQLQERDYSTMKNLDELLKHRQAHL